MVQRAQDSWRPGIVAVSFISWDGVQSLRVVLILRLPWCIGGSTVLLSRCHLHGLACQASSCGGGVVLVEMRSTCCTGCSLQICICFLKILCGVQPVLKAIKMARLLLILVRRIHQGGESFRFDFYPGRKQFRRFCLCTHNISWLACWMICISTEDANLFTTMWTATWIIDRPISSIKCSRGVVHFLLSLLLELPYLCGIELYSHLLIIVCSGSVLVSSIAWLVRGLKTAEGPWWAVNRCLGLLKLLKTPVIACFTPIEELICDTLPVLPHCVVLDWIILGTELILKWE